jgi:hypothetical protein
MPGAIIQLVSLGVQDRPFRTDPTWSPFDFVFQPYSYFALEDIEQTISGTGNFGKSIYADLTRTGDLIGTVTAEILLPAITVTDSSNTNASFRWVDNIGLHILKTITLEIGGTTICKHWGEFMVVWAAITVGADKVYAFNETIGQRNLVETVAATPTPATGSRTVTWSYRGLQTEALTQSQTRLMVELMLPFNTHAVNYMPLASIQQQQARLKIEFRSVTDCYIFNAGTGTAGTMSPTTPALDDFKLWVTHIFLDEAERKNYTPEVTNEYVIYNVQHAGPDSLNTATSRVKLTYAHPVVELLWFVLEDTAATAGLWYNFDTYSAGGPAGAANLRSLTSAKLTLNGTDRFTSRQGVWFNRTQMLRHHSVAPKSQSLYCYSFALQPEALQPNGSCNFTRFENAYLELVLANVNSTYTAKSYIFGRSLNLFRVYAGLAGVAFAIN